MTRSLRRRDFNTLFLGAAFAGATGSSLAGMRSRNKLVVRDQLFGLAEEKKDSDRINVFYEDFPGRLKAERKAVLSKDSNAAHTELLAALEVQGGAQEFDLFIADVVWIQELAKAGWIADLSPYFSTDWVRKNFFKATAEAVIYEGKTWAVPYYVDVGLLYYRKDKVPRPPPSSYGELEQAVTNFRANNNEPAWGYLWQGGQGEALVCNVLEIIWGHQPEKGPTQRIDTPEAAEALEQMLRWVDKSNPVSVSPPGVTSAGEEDTRIGFQNKLTLFQRNWPYVWTKYNSEFRENLEVAPLPSGPGTLGGYQLVVNANSPMWRTHRDAVLKLLEYLTSPEANLSHATDFWRSPPRPTVYKNPALPSFFTKILPMIEKARPRPATPYYTCLSNALQREFSNVLTEREKDLSMALFRAQSGIDHWTRVDRPSRRCSPR